MLQFWLGRRGLPLVAVILLAATAACGGGDEENLGIDASPADAGADTDTDAGVLEFMSPCDLEDDRCDGEADPPEFCFGFNAKGPHCTHACTQPTDCRPPSDGCSNMGVCKVP